MSKIKYTVVGEFVGDDNLKYNRIETYIDAANMALKDSDSPIRITTYDALSSLDEDFVKQQAAAEAMLLDWITDAEIGEYLFGILSSLDSGMMYVNEMVGSDALMKGKGARAWQCLTECRRDMARHLRWLDKIAVRRGRPGLAPDDMELIEE